MEAQDALGLAKQITEIASKIKEMQNEHDRLKAQFENHWNQRAQVDHFQMINKFIDSSELAAAENTPESISRKIRQMFANSPGEIFSLGKLQDLFPNVPADTLRSTLSRLATKHHIENIERGLYKHSTF